MFYNYMYIVLVQR